METLAPVTIVPQRERTSALAIPFLLPEAQEDKSPKSSSHVEKITEVEEQAWLAKTKERQLIRERGSLQKEVRELHHSATTFNRAKHQSDKKHFKELLEKISILARLHAGSYQLNKRNTVNRIENKRKSLKQINEEGRKRETALTTTELRYQELLAAMEQIMVEAEQLGLEFERKLKEKARQHHELGRQVTELGAQLRLEKDKKEQFLRDEERRKREDAMQKLSHWRHSELMEQQLKSQLKTYEDEYCDKSGKSGRKKRDMDHNVSLKRREYGRKLQDVNCLLKKVGEEQKELNEARLHIENQSVIATNSKNVQDHLNRQQQNLAQRQTKANRWQPKLGALARENESRLEKLEKHVLYEDVVKAGARERDLYRTMRSLESETRKQEQVWNHKKQQLDNETSKAKKQALEQIRVIDSQKTEMEQTVAREEALLRQLVVQRDNALTEYRQHQASLKDTIQLFQTLSSEQERKTKLAEAFS